MCDTCKDTAEFWSAEKIKNFMEVTLNLRPAPESCLKQVDYRRMGFVKRLVSDGRMGEMR